jgi:hypothetical protein
MSEYQEEVLTNLLDLQAELRGDESPPERPSTDPIAGAAATTDDPPPEPSSETMAVTEQGVTVSVAGAPATNGLAVNERLVALNERLARLEHDLAGVTKRIERIEPDTAPRATDADADLDAPWRSFLDLQKIVADRLDQR